MQPGCWPRASSRMDSEASRLLSLSGLQSHTFQLQTRSVGICRSTTPAHLHSSLPASLSQPGGGLHSSRERVLARPSWTFWQIRCLRIRWRRVRRSAHRRSSLVTHPSHSSRRPLSWARGADTTPTGRTRSLMPAEAGPGALSSSTATATRKIYVCTKASFLCAYSRSRASTPPSPQTAWARRQSDITRPRLCASTRRMWYLQRLMWTWTEATSPTWSPAALCQRPEQF
mmetsp:Transcript_30820/g.77065  ORF Transcript_30820/g.77065 Transcript_30820/m.77065 type:complete len:229 (-) Transcript_30820:354-1040(-)